jgi:hypothetical protein
MMQISNALGICCLTIEVLLYWILKQFVLLILLDSQALLAYSHGLWEANVTEDTVNALMAKFSTGILMQYWDD